MAQNMLIFTCLFLVLIFSQEIQSIEGRHLKVRKNDEFQTLKTQNKIYQKETFKPGGKLHADDTTKEVETIPTPPDQVVGVSKPPPPSHDIGDFRPTAPGNSPGVGHSLQEIQSIEGRHLKVRKNDEFQSLKTQNQIYQKETFKSGDKLHADDTIEEAETITTAPGPVVGVSKLPPPSHDIGDFRPTAPGNSPGVGHSLQN